MKIVEIAYNWPVEIFIERHLDALLATNINTHLIVRHQSVQYGMGASVGSGNAPIKVMAIPNFDHMSFLQKIWSLRYLISSLLQKKNIDLPIRDRVLLGYFMDIHPDLFHFHDASLAALMCWIPIALDIPYSLSLRGSDIQIQTLQSLQLKEAIRSAIGNATKVHAVSNSVGMNATRMLNCDLDFSVIYTTLPIPSALPLWHGVPTDGQIHFISSGRLVWMKGFPDLLYAFYHLLHKGVNARLTIAGVGPDLDHLLYLRKLLGLESVVDFPGKLDYVQIQDLFKVAHAYIQSSVTEGLSNSLIEAMANGLPVFATDVGGTKEVVEDGITGFLLSPLEPRDWATKLILVRNSALMERIRTSAYDKAVKLFSPQNHANAFVSFFNEALHTKRM